jgi:hypothetical protein
MTVTSSIGAPGARLASFWISKAQADETAPLPADLAQLRYRGWRGGVIESHRAFAIERPHRGSLFSGIALMLGLPLLWLAMLDRVGVFWGHLFAFWSKRLRLGSQVVMVPQTWTSLVHFSLPSLSISAGGPDPGLWWITATATVLLVLFSLLISEENMPWVYLLRALAIIQTTALAYFAVAAARFPHDLATYTVGMLVFGAILIGLVPVVLGFTFYIFDFGFWKKLGLTLLIMGHLLLFIPLQYLLQALVLKLSVVFMPILYFALGPFLDVLVLIAFYGWGMSWKQRS